MSHKETMTNRDVLELMLKYADEVEGTIKRFGDDYQLFVNDFVYYNALSMPIYQFAEQSLNLSENVKKLFGEINWHPIRGMRNLFAHAYGSMSPIDIWETAHEDLPELKTQLRQILADQSPILNETADGRKND
ncbi:HepT-like ribonuclease domain-containing protein [Secundilactobacillus similis]|uniref:DUF86 domain-containing protein n=1 Tax=Secundilactobacillus similis DSM 23365 = JCM 2765 TaxID=1423804 RepID=A0A0R2F6M3_9LACO|nr:HepT-like ribonuclease domain-containing protein [Secundilactobacillus similis]KRN21159.1 hypothetical protein FD14_GL001281 [Secundilactobacillus similis DSM 23365 = JCM 2765]